MSKVKRTIALAALMTAMIGAPAMALNAVVRSQGPSASIYHVGDTLPRGRLLLLRPGDHVTLSLETGGTRQFDGPCRCDPQRPSPRAELALWKLLFDNPTLNSVIGAARGPKPGPDTTPANVWQIDVAWPGDLCFAAGQPVELWRTDTDDTTVVIITRMGDGGSERILTWRAGEAALDVPADLPPADGEVYRMPNDNIKRWHVVDPPSGDLTAFAGQLLQNRCFAQAITLRVALGAGDTPQPQWPATGIVVRSKGPSASTYRVGYVLPPGRPLLLRPGDHVTIAENGETRQFDGPGRFFPQQTSPRPRMMPTTGLGKSP